MNQIDIDTQELKSMAPIIPYIKTYYKDKIFIERESGNVAFAKCIFHDENTASLAIYANGTYKCFGCGEHGDLITLVQKIENLDFQSACILIANNVGYQIKEVYVNQAWEQYKDMLDEHTRRYWLNLQHNADALNYVVNVRRISPEMINTFRLGFTDNEEYKYRNDMPNISNRIVFPILEHKKFKPKCVGMAYRGLRDEKPKYINDHNQCGQNGQNPALNGVFIKGNMLYGLAQAFKAIIKNNFVFVVEGYFDVIAMHQSGFTNTVGLMGTSFTEEQIKEIRKVTNNVFLLLDSDNAGTNAMEKHITKLIKYDIRPVICVIDGYKDPDEMCKAFDFNQQEIYNFINAHQKEGIHHLIMSKLERYKAVVSQERVKILTTLYPIINSIPNPAIKQAYLKEIEKEMY